MGKHPSISREFVSLLTDHQEIIRSYIISQMPGSSDVRDVLQEVNIVLWEKMGQFEPGTNFGAWACTVAHYKVLEHRKKEARRKGFLIFNDALSHSLAVESEDREPAELEARRRALDLCLAKLSARNRDLLRARYNSPGGDMDRIAAETGRSRASLRVTLFRLRSVLRRCIRSYLAREGGVS